jgi:phenylalanyl-tRNA synthetase alpha chain
MALFQIPDIRYFWSTDPKFRRGELTTFVPYSQIDPVSRDISFWLPEDSPSE